MVWGDGVGWAAWCWYGVCGERVGRGGVGEWVGGGVVVAVVLVVAMDGGQVRRSPAPAPRSPRESCMLLPCTRNWDLYLFGSHHHSPRNELTMLSRSGVELIPLFLPVQIIIPQHRHQWDEIIPPFFLGRTIIPPNHQPGTEIIPLFLPAQIIIPQQHHQWDEIIPPFPGRNNYPAEPSPMGPNLPRYFCQSK